MQSDSSIYYKLDRIQYAICVDWNHWELAVWRIVVCHTSDELMAVFHSYEIVSQKLYAQISTETF